MRAIEIEIAGARDTLATKHDLLHLRQELHNDTAQLRIEIHASASGITRPMYAALLGQMAVLLGFACFFATYVR